MKLMTPILQVFDPAMCCSTGVCGPDVDPKLVQFAADLDWLKSESVIVQRYNLSQNPSAFVENKLVNATLADKGEAALPLVVVNGKLAVTGRYPNRRELAALAGLAGVPAEPSLYSPAVNELVAIGAAIAANCEPCLKYHYGEAQKLGVSKGDMARAVEMAAKVKDSPHQAILRLANRLTGTSFNAGAAKDDKCSGTAEVESGSKGKCCG
jgi:AhpD family alkylhydroperoxidase